MTNSQVQSRLKQATKTRRLQTHRIFRNENARLSSYVPLKAAIHSMLKTFKQDLKW